MAVKRVRVVVAGQVQGVGFRWFCREQALVRGLGGWVGNRPDGRVEAEFEGTPEAVDGMVEWCRTGPEWAAVEGVEVEDLPPQGETAFVIAR